MSKSNTNIGLLYYKRYFKNKRGKSIFKMGNNEYKELLKKINSKIIGQTFLSRGEFELSNQKFRLKTIYPGMIIGSGYNHDIKKDGDIENKKNMTKEEPFKLGFQFDYTTGMPIIPGSSVKGLLRSVFPKYYNRDERKEREEYIKSLLPINKQDINIISLENEIFEGNIDNKYLPITQRDVFFDAEIVDVDNPNKKFLAKDYITPHDDGNVNSLLKDPKPIMFLKILPNVVFEFRFRLSNYKGALLNVDEKLNLFRNILLDIGVGAKTNVGYGQFDKKYVDNDIINLYTRKNY